MASLCSVSSLSLQTAAFSNGVHNTDSEIVVRRCRPVSLASPSKGFQQGGFSGARGGPHKRAFKSVEERSRVFKGVQERLRVSAQSQDAAAVETFPKLKEFLGDAKSVGRVRLIVNTGLGVLESVTTLEKLFYSVLPGKGEYANLMVNEDNVDFHMLLDKVAKVRLETGQSMRGNIPTYLLRFVDAQDAVGASVFVMWKPGTAGEYDPGQVEAFQALVAKYGKEVRFMELGSEEASLL